MKIPASILLAALSASTSMAQGLDVAETEEPLRHYTVEVIVFAYTEDVSTGSEIFLPDEPPAEEPIPEFGDVVTPAADDEDEEDQRAWEVVPAFTDPAAQPAHANPFQLVLLREDQHQLGNALRKFELLDAYETIMHVGWTQPAFAEDDTPAIELRMLGRPPAGLDGTLSLYLSRYLHLVVDLALEAPESFEEEVADDDDFFSFRDAQREYGDAQPVYFRIQDDRIFRNGELRYFDHPKFGILAKVSRVEESDE